MIIPAIDLMDGKCVRLFKGDFSQRTNYEITPLDVAQICARDGAQRLHVVDLDGARYEKAKQADLVVQIARESGLSVQSGGGIRDISQIHRLLEGGVDRVVIGSLAVTNPQMVKFWLNDIGPDKIVLALDVQIDSNNVPFPATRGWTETGEQTLWEVLETYSKSGLKHVLVTDIDRDGVLKGANVDLYKDIMTRFPDLKVTTSGGVGSIEDVKALKAINPDGIIIGKALFENKFTLAEAIAC
jgi:phosphoribosylformimino-5-aminoimidazole carboxamide ribotide isomerase